MPTSGSTNFNLTAEEIVTEICEQLCIIPIGGTVPGELYTSIIRTLNLMLKDWQMDGIFLNLEQQAYIFLNPDQQSYQLGGSGADKAVTDYNYTYISSDEASGQTTLSVTSSSDMAVNDVIGIQLDDGTLHWSTITNVPTSTTVTINNALTDDASANNIVYTYDPANVIGRPIEVSDVQLHIFSSGNDLKVYPIAKRKYNNIPNKSATGQPFQYFIDKQNSYTKLHIYPTSSSVDRILQVTIKRVIEDLDSSVDSVDMPQEWLKTIVSCGCIEVANKFNKAPQVSEGTAGSTSIAAIADKAYRKLKGSMQEYTSIKFRPRIRRR